MAQQPTLFILNADNGFSLQTNVVGDSIQLQKGANFQQQDIINRSSPIVTFSNSTPLTLNCTLEFLADGQNLMAQDLNNLAKGLLSLTYPDSSGIQPPPVCTITLGSGLILKNWQSVCTNCTPVWGKNNMYFSSGDPMYLEVALSFLGFETTAVNSANFAGAGISSFSQLGW